MMNCFTFVAPAFVFAMTVTTNTLPWIASTCYTRIYRTSKCHLRCFWLPLTKFCWWWVVAIFNDDCSLLCQFFTTTFWLRNWCAMYLTSWHALEMGFWRGIWRRCSEWTH
jgi:hypothetical protein